MFEHGIENLDHPVIAVREMEQARSAYERLGFTVPPRGSHVEWGTGNWCIMFPDNYLELRGVVDSSRYTHHLDTFLAKGEGLMGIALGTGDANASHDSLAAAGLHPGEVRELSRNFELPEGWVRPRFSLCFLGKDDTPGLESVVFCQHWTPELIRRPEWLVHPNGATHVASVRVRVKNAGDVIAPYTRLFGDAFATTATGGKAQLGRTTLQFTTTPGPVAVCVGVSDLAATRECLSKSGVFYRDSSGVLTVEPRDACGIALEFSEKAGH